MGEIRLITKSILLDEVKLAAQARFGDMVKAVVDIEKNVMALGGELHADEEALLLQNGSKQENLWGINLYVDLPWPEMVEFDSMINIRPRQNNRTRSIEDLTVRSRVLSVVSKIITL